MRQLGLLHTRRQHGDVVRLVLVQRVLRLVDHIRCAGRHDDSRDLVERRYVIEAVRTDIRALDLRRRDGVLRVHEHIDVVLVHNLEQRHASDIAARQTIGLAGYRVVFPVQPVLCAGSRGVLTEFGVRDPVRPIGDPGIAARAQVSIHIEREVAAVRRMAWSDAERIEVGDRHRRRERRLALAQLQQVLVRGHVMTGHGEDQLALVVAAGKHLGHEPRQQLR